MPLGPRQSAFLYDRGVYSLPNASGTPFIDLTRTADVDAINQLQYLSAAKNLYFKKWEDAERAQVAIALLSSQRAAAAFKTTVLVPDQHSKDSLMTHVDPKTGQARKLRRATSEEEKASAETYITVEFNYPQPQLWLSQLAYRKRPQIFDNGTAIGRVRKPEWLSTRN
jgi:hypothetical protein